MKSKSSSFQVQISPRQNQKMRLQQQPNMYSPLPQLREMRIGEKRDGIHSLARDKIKRIGRIDLIRQGVVHGNSPQLHQYVRMSFSNKTVVYKKRVFGQDKSERQDRENNIGWQYHQSNKIVIVKQTPRIKTQPSCSQLKGCKSLLNTKVKQKKFFFDVSRRQSTFQKSRNQNLLTEVSVNTKIGMCEDENEQFDLLPWQNQETRIGPHRSKEDRVLKPICRYY